MPPVKVLVGYMLLISIVTNLCMFIHTRGGNTSVLQREDVSSKEQELRDLINSVIGHNDLESSSSNRALLLHSLFDCLVEKFFTSSYKTTLSESINMTRTEFLSLAPALGDNTLRELNSRLRSEVVRLNDVISFLGQPIRNHHDFDYIHNPSNACATGETEVLFIVPSAVTNFEKRQKVRESQRGKYVKDKGNRAKILFFVGTVPIDKNNSHEIQRQIDQEFETYGDIVQESFPDVYSNIRLKAVSMLRWVSSWCMSAKYVVRTDDDVEVDPERLVKAVRSTNERHLNFILGHRVEGWEPVRNKEHKNYISVEEYPETTLPPFALGGLLGYPANTVRLLYQAALRVPPIWLDDVYITGICAPKVSVPLIKDPTFDFRHNAW